MKNKGFFTNVFSNLVIVLIIVSVLMITVNTDPTRFTSGGTYSAIYRGNTDNNNVSLMFNVYSGTELIEPILNVLNENNIKATFFIGGCWANSNPEILKSIYNTGEELGNHGYFHKDHARITNERNHEEIYINHELVKALTGCEMNLFAPPSGSFNSITLEIAQNLNYKTIMWSKDTIDWRDQDTTLIYNRATKNPQNGDLILLHPTNCTLTALQDIITFYKNNNFNLVTVSQNIM